MNKCILCKNMDFSTVVNLGHIFPSAFIDTPDNLDENKYAVHTLLQQCRQCKFVQLAEFLPPDEMYREYWYRSGINHSMVSSLRDIVQKALEKTPLSTGAVMDIGCNDGTMLSFYPQDVFKVGFDPANNLADKASENCSIFINDYFTDKIHFDTKFDIITAIAMFYDVPEPRQFLQTVKNHLAPHGTFIIQMTDLTSMLQVNAFDNICHEHIAYYKLMDLYNILTPLNLEIYDIEYNDVNGASIRVYINHDGVRPISQRYVQAIKREVKLYHDNSIYTTFNEGIQDSKEVICKLLTKLKEENKVVLGYGASTKGNTLLQYFKINEQLLPAIMEVTKEKWGKFTIGSNIPIISEEEGFARSPEYLLVLPWHFINNFIEKNTEWLNNGGKFIVPLPYPAIIDKYGYNCLSLVHQP